MRPTSPGWQSIGGVTAMWLLNHPCDGPPHKVIWDRPGYFDCDFLDDSARREIEKALSDLEMMRVDK